MLDTPTPRRGARLAVIAVCLLLVSPAKDGHAQADLDATERVVIASRIYSLVQHYFAHWEGVPRAEFESAYREYIGESARATDRRGFDLATLRLIATLRNGHTQFNDTQADARPLKFRLLDIENAWVVIATQDSRLARGAIVRALDGRPTEDYVRESSRLVAASNERLARTHVFSSGNLFPDRVSLTLQDGSVVVIDRTMPADLPQPAAAQASQGRWLREQQLAYLSVPSFGDAAFERTAIDLVRQFSSAPTLIVDVRRNGGGTTPRALIAALMNRPWRTWQESTPQHIALFEAQGSPQVQAARASRQVAPSGDAYQGRLFLLVDRFCGSACEDFVMPFKDTGRATIVGETTQGSSGNPYRTSLGLGMSIAIGAVRYRFPDGAPFEGLGIVPDVIVERRIADVAAGRDAVLLRAETLAGDPR